jgi:hypothetical protein
VSARRILLAAAPLGLAVLAIVVWVEAGAEPEAEPGPQADVWEFLVAGSVVLWTALASAGVSLLETLPRRDVRGFLAAVYGAMALLLVLTALAGVENGIVIAGQQWKNVLLHVIAAVTILPWLTALERIRLAATDDWPADAAAIERIRALRGQLQAATAALGGMVAVAVLLSGALRNAVAEAGLEPTPDAYVLVYGAWLTAILAAVYLRVFGAIERCARAIVERAVPLPDPAAEAFPAAVERRGLLAQELGMGGDPRSNLESLVAVLAPLAGALLTRVGGL